MREFEAFTQAGYGTELRVVAVPPEVSRRRRLEDYVTRTEGPWRIGSNSQVATNAATGQGWNDGQQANLGAAELLST